MRESLWVKEVPETRLIGHPSREGQLMVPARRARCRRRDVASPQCRLHYPCTMLAPCCLVWLLQPGLPSGSVQWR